MKDARIRELLNRIDPSVRGWTVVDHWEGDCCAIGVAAMSDLRRLVYISTFGKAGDRFDLECEVGSLESDSPFRTVDSRTDVDFDELLAVMTAHLSS